MGKKRKQPEPEPADDDHDSEDGKDFDVEVFLAAKVQNVDVEDMNDAWHYKVRWYGYTSKWDTWEPYENVKKCDQLLARFWQDVGSDNQDYEKGYTVYASKEFVEREKRAYRKAIARKERRAELKRKLAEEDELLLKPRNTSESDDEKPLRKRVKVKKEPAATPSESEAEPLSKVIENSLNQASSSKKASSTSSSRKPSAAPEDDDELRLVKSMFTNDDDEPEEPPLFASSPPTSPAASPAAALPVRSPSPIPTSNPTPSQSPSLPSASTSTSFTVPPLPQPLRKPSLPLAQATRKPSLPQPVSNSTTPTVTPKLPSFLLPQPKPKPKPSLPRAKTVTIPHDPSASGSGLTTKQRLAQNALMPTLPKEVPKKALSLKKGVTASVLKSLPSMRRKQTDGQPKPTLTLDTSEHSISGQVGTRTRTPTTSSLPGMSPALPFQSTPTMSPRMDEDSPPARSPQEPMDRNETSFSEQADNNNAGSEQPEQTQQQQAEVDAFLADLMPDEMRMEEQDPIAVRGNEPADSEDNTEVFQPPKSLPKLPASTSLPVASKQWTWTGALELGHEDGWSRLCSARISEIITVEPHGMPFIAMSEMSELRFEKLYDTPDAEVVIDACNPVSQFARLTVESDNDQSGKRALKELVDYMEFHHKVAFVPVSVLGTKVDGYLLFFPHSIRNLVRGLGVPPTLDTPDGALIACIMAWRLTTQDIAAMSLEENPPMEDIKTEDPPEGDDSTVARVLRNPLMHSKLQNAIRILRWPMNLHEFMHGQSDREYCIWRGQPPVLTYETELLQEILRSYPKARHVESNKSSKLVFIHAGALDSLHRFPLLAYRLSQRLDVLFYIYGTHEDAEPSSWGIREIFPLGGIVTFSAQALVQDPVAVAMRIQEISEHPLWAGYLIPAVFGMAVRTLYQDSDPLDDYDRGTFVFESILKAIDKGLISLMCAPPVNDHDVRGLANIPMENQSFKDETEQWAQQQITCVLRDPRENLQYCLEQCEEMFGPQAARRDTLSPIQDDMTSMRIQRAIMENYRRYVVLCADEELIHSVATKNLHQFEWLRLSGLDLKDSFFAQVAQ